MVMVIEMRVEIMVIVIILEILLVIIGILVMVIVTEIIVEISEALGGNKGSFGNGRRVVQGRNSSPSQLRKLTVVESVEASVNVTR